MSSFEQGIIRRANGLKIIKTRRPYYTKTRSSPPNLSIALLLLVTVAGIQPSRPK